MKVVLIAAPIMDYNHEGQLIPKGMDALRACPSYGVCLLAAILQSKGYDVVLADLIAQGSANLWPYLADINDCSLVGIGTSTLSWPAAIDVIKAIRLIRNDVPIVLGGIHPTMFDGYILKKFPVQYVIRGEGEGALVSLCDNLENTKGLKHVPNLSRISNYGEIIRNPIAPAISGDELGSLPLPDYDSLPLKVYHYLRLLAVSCG